MPQTLDLDNHQITNDVIASVKNILEENDVQLDGKLDASTTLLGRQSVLDSLGLVTLLVDLEQQIEEKYNIAITLADDRAMSQESSPFKTVQTLSGYICLLLQEILQSDRA